MHRLVGSMMVNHCSKLAMEQCEEGVVLAEDLVEDLRIFFAESAVLKLSVSNRLTSD